MSFVNLRKVVYFNFRTLQGLHQIEFAKNGLVAIKGVNLDTKGRSGAGKTNVILGIAYLFGHCPHPANTLQYWYDEAPFYVEGHFDTSDGPAVLVRGAKGMSMQVGAEKKLTGSKAVEERLDRLCGVRGDLREILTYRDQKKPQKFLGMKDTELKEFLALVLGLTDLDKQIDASTKKLSLLEKQVVADAGALKTWEDVRGDRKDVWTELPPAGVSWQLERQVADAAASIEVSRKVEGDVYAQLMEARKQEEAAARAAGMSNAKDVEYKKSVLESIRAKLLQPFETYKGEELRLLKLIEDANGYIADLNEADNKRYVEHRKKLEEIGRCCLKEV